MLAKYQLSGCNGGRLLLLACATGNPFELLDYLE
jgi:hypothetical protein